MDRFEGMSMLLAVVDNGSFSAAARAVRIPVATLSRRVSELEARLGARLLIRTTRKLTLTEAGIRYVARTRRMLEQLKEAEREAAGEFIEPKGELVVSAPLVFGRLHVVPIVADFLAQFPDISIRILLADRNVDLLDEHVDMAVRVGELPDSDMIATRIGSMRTVVCASPSLLQTHGIPQKPQSLLHFPCGAFDGPMPSPGWRFGPAATVVPVKPRLSVSTADAARQAAILSVGVTRLLYYQVVEEVEDGRLTIILEAFEPKPAPVHLLHAARGQLPLKMRRFIDFAGPKLRHAMGELGTGLQEYGRLPAQRRGPPEDCAKG